VRGIDELTNVDQPAWPELQALFAASAVPLKVLPAELDEGRRALMQLQVTARSMLGALVLNCGGLIVDGGWVRVFGGGRARDGAALPGLAQVNAFPAVFDAAWRPAAGLVAGHDVLGGVFALNGHDPAAAARPGAPGEMTYFAPDTLRWEPLGISYPAWVSWLLSGRLAGFYEALRWPGWREETAALGLSQGIAVYPFLWSRQAQENLTAASRAAVPMQEILGVAADSARQMDQPDPGFLGVV
jgi:uncharacterized protein DUF2625